MKPSLSPSLWPLLTLITVLKAEIRTLPKVWGYVGQEVILPCELIGQNKENVTLVQWELPQSGDNSNKIVHNVEHQQTNIPDPYKDRTDLKDYSLVIKNLEAGDAGEYICSMTTFPGGSHPGSRTTLVVNKQMPLSAGVVSSIVISVILLLGIIAATVYFTVIRRRAPSSRNHIFIDTQNAVWDPSKPSLIKREEVVYAAVKLQSPNHSRVKSSDDYVTYSEVNMVRARRDEELYEQVMEI
ncbi:hypothetical protein NL108_000196 [Boleophthalmus pectinirostris]|uniref:nectin-3-like n=1 Tax=Boleophthalmus pectinirostris TaxID=150288 RepID=UPI00242F43BD|nr:nectin-3-like [Boleophthalmus pectinirostris]KAJ0065946.1 hypothetical protein NL108_000196 [Boleophthalmus pectinirostris]